jgi:hypothetical protein
VQTMLAAMIFQNTITVLVSQILLLLLIWKKNWNLYLCV